MIRDHRSTTAGIFSYFRTSISGFVLSFGRNVLTDTIRPLLCEHRYELILVVFRGVICNGLVAIPIIIATGLSRRLLGKMETKPYLKDLAFNRD